MRNPQADSTEFVDNGRKFRRFLSPYPALKHLLLLFFVSYFTSSQVSFFTFNGNLVVKQQNQNLQLLFSDLISVPTWLPVLQLWFHFPLIMEMIHTLTQ